MQGFPYQKSLDQSKEEPDKAARHIASTWCVGGGLADAYFERESTSIGPRERPWIELVCIGSA